MRRRCPRPRSMPAPVPRAMGAAGILDQLSGLKTALESPAVTLPNESGPGSGAARRRSWGNTPYGQSTPMVNVPGMA
jgi:hypothetical protein